MIYGWDSPYNLIKEEIAQQKEEGFLIPQAVIDAFNKIDPALQEYDEKTLEPLYHQLQDPRNQIHRKDWPYTQPDSLKEIRSLRPEGPRQLILPYNSDELLNRFHGAWTGRACGCALGKPVEIIGFSPRGRQIIKNRLQRREAWPLADYFSGTNLEGEKEELCSPQSWKENIAYMEADDDIHYTLIALKVLEEKGDNFTWRDVADMWNSSLPYQAICTAETQAILNYNMKSQNLNRHEQKAPVSPDYTSQHNNPYREWIGAQIRADGWGFACAGNPEKAAELAWRDAHWTHRKNGIYGEMFVAAIIAAAFVERDPIRLITIGLSEIPRTSLLAEAMNKALVKMQEKDYWEDFMEWLEAEWGHLSPIHTINNALIVAMSLYYGGMNPDKSLSIAVMAGLDTDCNGATVGSITGAATGRNGFGDTYAPQLQDRIKPQVFGFQETTMKELALRTLKVFKEIS